MPLGLVGKHWETVRAVSDWHGSDRVAPSSLLRLLHIRLLTSKTRGEVTLTLEALSFVVESGHLLGDGGL